MNTQINPFVRTARFDITLTVLVLASMALTVAYSVASLAAM